MKENEKALFGSKRVLVMENFENYPEWNKVSKFAFQLVDLGALYMKVGESYLSITDIFVAENGISSMGVQKDAKEAVKAIPNHPLLFDGKRVVLSGQFGKFPDLNELIELLKELGVDACIWKHFMLSKDYVLIIGKEFNSFCYCLAEERGLQIITEKELYTLLEEVQKI